MGQCCTTVGKGQAKNKVVDEKTALAQIKLTTSSRKLDSESRLLGFTCSAPKYPGTISFENLKDNIRDEYQIGKIMGTGTFSEVRYCIHRKTGLKRGVKIIKKSHLRTKEEQRFLQEVNILKQLDHPNIVRMFDVFQDSKRYFIVTELCTGGELFDQILNRTHFSERDAAVFIKQALKAISYCHSKNIVHRDLKPENLLFETDDERSMIKVIDFGTSQVYADKKKMHKTYGTPYYIAPEILAGEYDEKCDVWSVGVIMFILLSGRPPFDGDSDEEILGLVSKGLYSLNDQCWNKISDEGIDLLKQMLTFQPKNRISAKDALDHPWINAQTEGVIIKGEVELQALVKMKNFRAEGKLQKAALEFIQKQVIHSEELSELKQAFKHMDKNGDGKLSREELLTSFQETMGIIEAQEEVERIMSNADFDNNGFIDYNEFVSATADWKKLMSQEKLKKALEDFKSSGGGRLNLEEFTQMLEQGGGS